MKEWLLSFVIWILLPVLLLLTEFFVGVNVLAVIILMSWLGFGFMVFSIPEE